MSAWSPINEISAFIWQSMALGARNIAYEAGANPKVEVGAAGKVHQ